MSMRKGLRSARRFPPGHFLEGEELLLFGHRGYSRLAPENTLTAFRLLLEHGIPGVEFDVHLCGSGEPVVIHDSELKRVTGVEARVEQTPYGQLRELDAGAWFGPSFRGERLPLLDEVFELLGRAVYYDVELKTREWRCRRLAERVLACIRAHGLQDRCLLSSFNPFCLRAVERLDPAQPTAVIWSRERGVHPLLRHGEGRLIARSPVLKPRHSLVRPGMGRGRPLISWTVDDPQAAAALVRMGVRGLVSNDPGRIREAMTGPRDGRPGSPPAHQT